MVYRFVIVSMIKWRTGTVTISMLNTATILCFNVKTIVIMDFHELMSIAVVSGDCRCE